MQISGAAEIKVPFEAVTAQGIAVDQIFDAGIALNVAEGADHHGGNPGGDEFGGFKAGHFKDDPGFHAAPFGQPVLDVAHAVPRREVDKILVPRFRQLDFRSVGKALCQFCPL